MGLLKSIKKASSGIGSVGARVLKATGKISAVTGKAVIMGAVKSNPLSSTAYSIGKKAVQTKKDIKKNIKTQQPIGLQVSSSGDVYKKSGAKNNDTDISSVVETVEKRKGFFESIFDLF